MEGTFIQPCLKPGCPEDWISSLSQTPAYMGQAPGNRSGTSWPLGSSSSRLMSLRRKVTLSRKKCQDIWHKHGFSGCVPCS